MRLLEIIAMLMRDDVKMGLLVLKNRFLCFINTKLIPIFYFISGNQITIE